MRVLPLWSEILAQRKRKKRKNIGMPLVFGAIILAIIIIGSPSVAEEIKEINRNLQIKKINIEKDVYKVDDELAVDIGNFRSENFKVTLTTTRRGKDRNYSVEYEIDEDNDKLIIKPIGTLHPGKYTIKVFDEEEIIFENNFSWGVLALNTHKSIYESGEEAHIAIAVLDEQGQMVCNAAISLKIIDPNLKTTWLTTDSGEIAVNPECEMHNFTLNPDYETAYVTGAKGTYEMELTAITKNGSYTIYDAFLVKDFVPFDVERDAATRIYPLEPYPVTLYIEAYQDFVGVIKETVPVGFDISPPLYSLGYNRIEEKDNVKEIYWDINIKEGDKIAIGYYFDAPNISPYFYTLGPLQFIQYQQVIYDPSIFKDEVTESTESDLHIGNFNLDATLESTESTSTPPLESVTESTESIELEEVEELTEPVIQPKTIINNYVVTEEIIIFEEARKWQLAIDAATQITTANSNDITRGDRTLVRTSSGILYAVILDTSNGDVEVWKSSDGSSWTEQATGTNWTSNDAVAAAIDSSNIIHIATWNAGTGLAYATYNTSTDSKVGITTIIIQDEGITYPYVSVSIDTSDKVHIAYGDGDKIQGKLTNMIFYTNNVSGTWASRVDVSERTKYEDSFYPSLTISNENYPEIAFVNTVDGDVEFSYATSNNPSSFTIVDVDISAVTTRAPSIAIDSSGDTWIAFVDGDNSIKVVEDTNGGGWSWNDRDTGSTGQDPSLVTDGTDTYVFYEDSANNISYDKYTTSWFGETDLETTSYNSVKARWAYNNNYSYSSAGGIDYLWKDQTASTDVWWNLLGFDITVSGTAYTNETGTTLNSSSGSIKLVNGNDAGYTASDTDGTDSSGLWSITMAQPPNDADILTIWINGASADGTLVLEYGPDCTGYPDCTGLSIYQDRVIIREENADTGLSNADLANCDSNSGTNCIDAEIGFTSDGGAATFGTATDDREVHIWNDTTTGDRYIPGGTVTTYASGSASTAAGDFHCDGTGRVDMSTYALSVGGDLTCEGFFSWSAGQTTTFTATATGHTIDLQQAGGDTFENVIFNGSGGGWDFTGNHTIEGNLTTTTGQLSETTNTIIVRGNIDGTNGTFNFSGGTLEQRVGGTTKTFGTTSGSTAWTFNNLTFSNSNAGSGATIDTNTGGTGGITINGNLLVSKGSDTQATALQAGNRTWTLANTNGSNPFDLDGTSGALTAETSTFVYSGDNDTGDVTVENTTYNNIQFGGATAETYDLEEAIIVSDSLTINANGTLDTVSGSNFGITVGGGYANNGTFTAQQGTVTFNDTSGDGAETLSGRLNNAVTSSTFYKVTFNGSGGAWTIQDAMKVSADTTTTLQIQQGTVTLGNGDNDDLEINGQMIVGSASSVATFQTMDGLAQGSEIIIDVNNNTSPVSCTNCMIDVGTSLDGDPQGTFTLNENAILRFNSFASVESGLEVLASGKLNITGNQDDIGTVTSISETVITASAESWGTNDHQNKHVRITNSSSLAFGTIHDISSNGTSTLTIPDNFTASDTAGSYSSSTRVFTAGTDMISANNDAIGQYLYNSTQGTRSRIVDSTENGSSDTITIANIPDTFLHSGGDTVTITYGILVNDTFEILDYATVTAQAGTSCNDTENGYIYGQADSEVLIQYADVCDLGASSAVEVGLYFVGIDGSETNQGLKIDKSRIHNNYVGIYFAANTYNNNANHSTGITNNRIYDSSGLAMTTNTSGNNLMSSNVISADTGACVYLSANTQNSIVSSNVFFDCSQGMLTSGGANNNIIDSNISFGNSSDGIAINSNSDENILASNTSYGNGDGIQVSYTTTSAPDNNVLLSNTSFSNTSYGFYSSNAVNTIVINDAYGVSGDNGTSDIYVLADERADTIKLYGTNLASTPTEVSGVTYTGAYVISKDHDPTGQTGLTKIWGEYTIPDDVTETETNNEGVQQFNYANNLYGDSATAAGYEGTGTEDSDIDINLDTATISVAEWYRAEVTTANGDTPIFTITRSGGTATPTTYTLPGTYTETNTGVKFTIADGAVNYAMGDTYTFVVWPNSADTSTTKTINIMQNSDTFTVGAGETVELKGQTGNLSAISANTGNYSFTIQSSGTIDGNYYSMQDMNGSGLNIQSGALVTDLAFGNFDNNGTSGGVSDAHITIDDAVISSNATYTGSVFADTNTYAEYNVTLTGTPGANYWTFSSATGALAGESYDNDNGDPGVIRWDDSGGNNAPNDPTSLAQKKTDDTVLNTGDWTGETSVKFTVSADDIDNPDTLYLCIEVDQLGTGFSNTEDSCGSGGVYSGSPITLTHTISSLVDATQFHWQARVKDTGGLYSNWVSYGGNVEGERDFGTDTTAPTGGTVYDGTEAGVDKDISTTSLSQLSANWDGVVSTVSGLGYYEYSIGTTQGGIDIKGWTNNGTGTSVTTTGLTLDTQTVYYFNLRTTDSAGNVQSPVISSDGQVVAPSLSFAVSPGTATFNNLNSGNSYTDTETSTLTTSTNAYKGYIIRAFTTDILKGLTKPSSTIGNFDGGTYASPDEWLTGDRGFGYTSNDTTIQGSNKFGSAPCAGGGNPPCYAPFSQSGPGDIVADHTNTVSGTPISNEVFTITYKVKTDAIQDALEYSTTVVYTITAQY